MIRHIKRNIVIHAANDIHGKSVFELPEDSNIMVGVHQALHNLGIF